MVKSVHPLITQRGRAKGKHLKVCNTLTRLLEGANRVQLYVDITVCVHILKNRTLEVLREVFLEKGSRTGT